MESNANHNRLIVFRVDNKNKEIYKELQQGRLRQGWGAQRMSLLDANGKPLDRETWTKNYEQSWGFPTKRRHSALAKMLEIEEGDIVMIPKVPTDDLFCLARVTRKYIFDIGPKKQDDFRHVIHIDPTSLHQFNYRANSDTFAVYGLLRKANHRYPVTFSYEPVAILAATTLLDGGQDRLDAKDSKELVEAALDDVLKKAARAMQGDVEEWNGHQFEAAVKQAFENQGYRQKFYRKFNNQGGDADMVFAPPDTIHSLFMPGEVIVQVKCKKGIDRNDLRGVEQLMKWKESEDSSARKFLISSGSDFTDECKKKADDENITLICGLNTMYFLMGLPPKDY